METVGAYGGPRNFKPKKPLKTFQLCLPTAAVAGLDGPCDVALELERLRAKGPSPFRILKTSSWVALPKTVSQEKSQFLRLVGTNGGGDF